MEDVWKYTNLRLYCILNRKQCGYNYNGIHIISIPKAIKFNILPYVYFIYKTLLKKFTTHQPVTAIMPSWLFQEVTAFKGTLRFRMGPASKVLTR